MSKEKSIKEVCEELGLKRPNLYGYLKKLKIEPKKKGNRSFITEKDTRV